MEEDGKKKESKIKDEDDLAKYNLDDYDKESSSIGEETSPSTISSIYLIFIRSGWTIQ